MEEERDREPRRRRHGSSMPAKAEYLILARLALAGIAREVPMSEPALADLKLAVTEACGNAVRHAYAGAPAWCAVRVRRRARMRSRSRSRTTGAGVALDDVPRRSVRRRGSRRERDGARDHPRRSSTSSTVDAARRRPRHARPHAQAPRDSPPLSRLGLERRERRGSRRGTSSARSSAGDLEDAPRRRLRQDDASSPSASRTRRSSADDRPERGRVEERDGREVEHDARSRRGRAASSTPPRSGASAAARRARRARRESVTHRAARRLYLVVMASCIAET